jgi:hypothetical protein
MGWNDTNSPGPWPARERRSGETEAEHAFWVRYWEVLRTKGIPTGSEVWYERACLRFIRCTWRSDLSKRMPLNVLPGIERPLDSLSARFHPVFLASNELPRAGRTTSSRSTQTLSPTGE